MTMFDADLSLRALNLASRAHAEQKDPGTGFPYVTHAVKVAMETLAGCAQAPALDANLALCCALLHDTVEDTSVTLEEIRMGFGVRVAEGVSALTKNPALPRADQGPDSLRRIRAQPREVWCVKLADRLTNLEIAPPYWSAERRTAYAEEARAIRAALGEASPLLAARLDARIRAYPTS
jgi:(p)ppGpp synthase/HD superfamily hydrolase